MMVNSTHDISMEEYSEFSEFLSSACGIRLGDNKQYLVNMRIRKILKEYNCLSLSDLTKKVKCNGDRILKQKVIDAMTTNETFWFRDNYPFDYLQDTVLPDLNSPELRIKSGGRKIRIWSSACSSGQEPYSISMLTEERKSVSGGNNNREVEIVATDLSSEILESAKIGCYDKLALIRGLSNERIDQFFEKTEFGTWAIDQRIKNRVSFKSLNLKDSFVLLGKFDVVFCRNVLIYFSAEFKREILLKVHSTLLTGGILFLGSSESVSDLDDYYEMIHCNPGIAYRAKFIVR